MDQFPEQEQEIKLRDYYRIILRHIKLILIIFVVVMVATIYYTASAPRIYESNGKILLELNKQTDLFFSTGGFGRNDLNNQMEVIKCPSVMVSAVEKLKRNPVAENFPILSSDSPSGLLAKEIEVSAEREVDIVDVAFKSTNPNEAQAAVNAVMDSYQDESLKYARAEVTSVREFLEKQLDVTSKKLAISEEDLRAYKIANEVFALSEETKEMIINMVEFEAQLSSAQTELQIVEKKLNDIMFGVPGTISGCNLTSEQIHIIMGGCEGEIYHRSSWENLDLRNISKSDISGPNIKDTDDYEKYDSHGDMSYTLFRSKKYDNCVFGVSKLGVVFTPNKKDQAFLIRVITEQVLPLL